MKINIDWNALFVSFSITFIIMMMVISCSEVIELRQKENIELNAQRFPCSGTVVKVETIEHSGYALVKNRKNGHWIGPTEQTLISFKDGRVKKFNGVPDIEIPIGQPVDLMYDGNGFIKEVFSSGEAGVVKRHD